MFTGEKTQTFLALINNTLETALKNLLWKDALTELPNIAAYREDAEKNLKLVRQIGRTIYLLFIEINHFKNINIKFGNKIGDDVLSKLAQILKKTEQSFNIHFYRRGGDEFTALTSESNAELPAQEIIKQIEQLELFVNDKSIQFSISIGYTKITKADNFDTIENRAWKACLAAKRQQGNTICHYKGSMKFINDKFRVRGHCDKCQTDAYFNVSQQITKKLRRIPYSCPICKGNMILLSE